MSERRAVSVRAARWLMKLRERRPPSPEREIGELAEVFQHPRFVAGSAAERHAVMDASSLTKFESERRTPWDEYFGVDLRRFLRGGRLLDLGCFTGGRSVAWAEHYGASRLFGIDVAVPFVDAARRFAARRGVRGGFLVAESEHLPFPDGHFDAVLACDVFEHVQDLGRTLAECHRVLKGGGHLVVAFPGFYHPQEHHLSLVTEFPGIHYLFGPRTLVEAYSAIVAERGDEARWYGRTPALAAWERGNAINGTTSRRFRQLLRAHPWKIRVRGRFPIGRRFASRGVLRPVYGLARLLAALPGLDEVLVNRIAYVLEKPVRA
jgi:SAM-dependent methyltransferase